MLIQRTLKISQDPDCESPLDSDYNDNDYVVYINGGRCGSFGTTNSHVTLHDWLVECLDLVMRKRSPKASAEGYSCTDEYITLVHAEHKNTYYFDTIEEGIELYHKYEKFIPVMRRLFIHEVSCDVPSYRARCPAYFVLPMEMALHDYCMPVRNSLVKSKRLDLEQFARNVVETYECWLSGDVYFFELFEHKRGEPEFKWKSLDCCGGFFGYDWETNGISGYLGVDDIARIDLEVIMD